MQARRQKDVELIESIIQRNVPDFSATWQCIISQIADSDEEYLAIIHTRDMNQYQLFKFKLGPKINDIKFEMGGMTRVTNT